MKSSKEIVVGLDMRPTEDGFKAHAGRGTGRYTAEVSRELADMSEEARELGLRIKKVYSRDFSTKSSLETLGGLLPFGRRTFESQFIYSRQIASLDVQLMHFFAHGDAPALCTTPQTVTVLDLIPMIFPELYRAEKTNLRFRFARFLEYQAICRSRGIFAISDCTKRDIVRLLGVSPEKIVVTPLAVGGGFISPPLLSLEDLRAAKLAKRREMGFPERARTMLYVGGIDPRKNVPFLLKVVAELRERAANAKNSSEDYLLLLAGNYLEDDQYPLLLSEIRRLGLSSEVRLLGFVSDEQLRSLYLMSDIFLFPSLYEGFGLPPLEAMRCGLPVVAGNNSSLPEVIGNAGVLVPDSDLAAWSDAILRLFSSEENLIDYARLGLVHSERFSWRHTARRTLQGFASFLRGENAS